MLYWSNPFSRDLIILYKSYDIDTDGAAEYIVKNVLDAKKKSYGISKNTVKKLERIVNEQENKYELKYRRDEYLHHLHQLANVLLNLKFLLMDLKLSKSRARALAGA